MADVSDAASDSELEFDGEDEATPEAELEVDEMMLEEHRVAGDAIAAEHADENCMPIARTPGVFDGQRFAQKKSSQFPNLSNSFELDSGHHSNDQGSMHQGNTLNEGNPHISYEWNDGRSGNAILGKIMAQ